MILLVCVSHISWRGTIGSCSLNATWIKSFQLFLQRWPFETGNWAEVLQLPGVQPEGERGDESLWHEAPVSALLQEVLHQGGVDSPHDDPTQDHSRHRQEHAQRLRLISAVKTSSWEVKVWWQNVPAKTTCNYGMQYLSISCTRIYFNLSNCQKISSGCVFQCLSRWNKLFFLNLTKINIQVMVWDLRWKNWRYRHKRRRQCSEDTTLPGNAVSVTRSGPPRGSLSNISAKLITLAARHSYSTTTASHINQSVKVSSQSCQLLLQNIKISSWFSLHKPSAKVLWDFQQ